MECLKQYFLINMLNNIVSLNIKYFAKKTIFLSIKRSKAEMNDELNRVKQKLQTYVTSQQLDTARQHLLQRFEQVFKLIIAFEKDWNIFRDKQVCGCDSAEEEVKETRANDLEFSETKLRDRSSTMPSNTKLKRYEQNISKSMALCNFESRLPLKETESLSTLLWNIYQKQRQSETIYKLKVELRQNIYSLLAQSMTEKIDLYLIGSSLTGIGSNTSDTDLCLIIYGSDDKIDKKYEDKSNAILKLHQINEILKLSGISVDSQVIPALVPILKFSDKFSGIEVNINLNRIVTIRNTHLLHTYSQIDWRVAPLILTVKLWARKNGINCAYNKSLTSYSLSLMVIYYLQSVCDPPVVPCLQQQYPQLFSSDVTQLRLGDVSMVEFSTKNNQSLGHLFTKFMQYFSLSFPFDKVISIRTGSLIDRSLLMSKSENSGKLWQWKSHICIEEPFDRTNTSHAVHECKMFRHILYSLMETFQVIRNNKLRANHLL